MRLSECFNLSQGVGDSLKCLLYTFFLIININYDLLILLFGIIVIDMGFGVLKAIRLKDKLSFSTFMFGFLTKMIMLLIPFTIAVLGISLGYEAKVFADATIRLLIANEVLSILANFLSIKNRKRVENIDLLTITLNLIRKHIEGFLKGFLMQKFGIKFTESQEEIINPEKDKENEI